MKSRLLSFVVIISVVLFASLICGGVALADDGSNDGGSFNWIAFATGIGVFAWAMYSPAVYAEWVDVWKDKKMGTMRKVGYSFRALGSCAGPVLVAVWKQYGASIIALITTLFKVKFGVPVAFRRAGNILKR